MIVRQGKIVKLPDKRGGRTVSSSQRKSRDSDPYGHQIAADVRAQGDLSRIERSQAKESFGGESQLSHGNAVRGGLPVGR